MYALLNSPTSKCLFHFLKEEMEGRVKFFSFLPHVMISEITFFAVSMVNKSNDSIEME